jgi:molybdopterin synthase catalytic subunit/molybdopterin converting factor small subunit
MAVELNLRYFAAARELAGCATETVMVPPPGDVATLQQLLAARGGRWALLAPVCRFARDDEFLLDGEALASGDEVLVLPPAAGGAARSQLTHVPIAAGAAEAAIDTDGVGGIASFVGTVRKVSGGKQVQHLEYSAYEPLAVKEMERICGEAMAQFGLCDVRIIHRLGLLHIGEVAVAIACAAPHRGAAFDACRWVIDELKRRVPIWKRETTEDGVVWVGATP